MKILVFSDLHRDKVAARSLVERSGEADILIGAGDQRFLAWAMAGAAAVAVPVMVATRLAGLGIGPLWAGIWAFMVVRGLSLGGRFHSDRWQVVGAGS